MLICFLQKFFVRPAALLAFVLLFAGCGRERVILLEPKESDLVVVNGCVISACNYLALVKTKHSLESDFWTKILLVRYNNHPAGHAYCVWETEGTIYGYDRNSGGFPIPVYVRDPRAIAIVLAQELSKILQEPLSVQSAEFIEPAQAPVYKYSVGSSPLTRTPLASTAPFPARKLSLTSALDPFAP